MKAATKLKVAAQRTASFGESTRVETTVAMLLAASESVEEVEARRPEW